MHYTLQRCLDGVRAAVDGMPPALAATRVDGRWSVIEVCEHLRLTYSGTAKGLERCLERGAPSARRATWRDRVRTAVVLHAGYFPTGIEAPKHVVPASPVDLAGTLDAVARDLERFDRTAVLARDRFGTGAVLDHPILGPFTVAQWVRFHWVHTRHHLKQIRARRAALEAPREG